MYTHAHHMTKTLPISCIQLWMSTVAVGEAVGGGGGGGHMPPGAGRGGGAPSGCNFKNKQILTRTSG